ncbi:MAG: M20/M25/M40 family metallo-hydrolase [Gemmatimonadota bacterium]
MRPGWMIAAVAGGALALSQRATAQSLVSPGDSALAHEIFAELIAIRSLSSSPAAVEAAEAVATRLRAAGFPEEEVLVVGPEPGVGGLVARYGGTGEGGRPILLMAHLDVVDALREDWSLDPFELIERDGWWYGRGTTDNKAGAAILVANFLRYRRDGFVPSRDLIMVLTLDEETGGRSIEWLVHERRDLVDAEFALNTDAGGGVLREGRAVMNGVQASEKVYLSFRLKVTNPGGHSSRPRPENAIYTLAAGLGRLASHRWPVELNEVTRGFFERAASLENGQTAADMRAVAATPPDLAAAERLAARSPYHNALMRTTCVATRLEAGHADNALPQTARAIVNCRILPGRSPDQVERTLNDVLADPAITVSRDDEPRPSPPSPLTPAVLGPIERLTDAMWPGVPVVPVMSTGATDGLYVRNAGIPVYGVAAIFEDQDDVRAHGKDERIEVRRFYEALEFWYRLVQELSR